jgi:hypothetical protein
MSCTSSPAAGGIACGWRPDWGYVDQPPLVPLIAAGSWHLFGGSLHGLRIVSALAGAATVAITVRAAGEFGGWLFARWLAGLCVMAAGILQLASVLLTTDTLQPLLWTALTLALMRALRGQAAWWWGVGALVGVAFQTKYMVLFQVAALILGILATPQRRVLVTGGPWRAALLALAIAAPNLGGAARAGDRGPEPGLAGGAWISVPGTRRCHRNEQERGAAAAGVPGPAGIAAEPGHRADMGRGAGCAAATAGLRPLALDRAWLDCPDGAADHRPWQAVLCRGLLPDPAGGWCGGAGGVAAPARGPGCHDRRRGYRRLT